MKYNININQIALAKTSLDIADGAILDYLYYLCSSLSEKVEKHRKDGYTWVNFNYLMEEMPLLRVKSKSRISERIKKISKEGFLNTKREGNKFYVKLTAKVDELFVKSNNLSPPFEKSNGSVLNKERKTPPAVRKKEHNHNTNNHSIKTNVNVDKKNKKFKPLTDTQRGQLEYHLEKIGELKNVRAFIDASREVGFQNVINTIIDVTESDTAKNKGACIMGILKKMGYKNFFRPNKDRL